MPAIISYNNRLITSNPTTESILDAGAYRAFTGGISEINNIPVDRRKPGMLVSIENGTRFFVLNTAPWTQTDSDWTEIAIIAKTQEIKFIDQEIPIGEIDNTNTIFQLTHEPLANSDHVYLNGLLQERGENSDYIIQEKKIIFSIPPFNGAKIKCSYRYC
jgi:hypothetical protein